MTPQVRGSLEQKREDMADTTTCLTFPAYQMFVVLLEPEERNYCRLQTMTTGPVLKSWRTSCNVFCQEQAWK